MKHFKYMLLMVLALPLMMVSCSKDSAKTGESDASSVGQAGSYARFAVVGDYMYVVDHADIQTFSLADPTSPEKIDVQNVGGNIETIFNLDDKLFIGSGTGLYLYTVDADGKPKKAGTYSYDFEITPCDPVVADQNYAYVTLNTITPGPCGTNTQNLLNIFDITDFDNPQMVAQYDMYGPKGVGIDGNTLFVCDEAQGLKIYDVSNPQNIQMIKHFPDMVTYDVITVDGLLLVVGPNALVQFDYTDLNNIVKVSEIPIFS